MLEGHILIAEDEENISRVLSLLLKRRGYTVSTARDGSQALEMIVDARKSDQPVDLLLTDVQMEGMTGFELVAELDKMEPLLPVLFMTGFAREQAPVKTEERFVRFIEKPFKAEKLIELISTALKD